MLYTMPKMNLGIIRLDEAESNNSDRFDGTTEAIEQSLATLQIEPGTGAKILSRYHMGVMETMKDPEQARRYIKDLEQLGACLYG